VVSPVDGSLYLQRPLAGEAEVTAALRSARAALPAWRELDVGARARICSRAMRALAARRGALAEEITWQMGRPVRDSAHELHGVLERTLYMCGIAEEALADVRPDAWPGFERFIRRTPVGVVLSVAPWNYPYLTAVNSIVPALVAGNTVLLKHSPQVPLCAERFAEAFGQAGLPEGVFQVLHCAPEAVARMVAAEDGVDFVVFTGSVETGRAVQRAASARFIGVALELGGKDPAYVRADADATSAAEGIVSGAFYNAGQSCCAVERAYVHTDVYDAFLTRARELGHAQRLGDPRAPETTLGPVVGVAAAQRIRERLRAAIADGARPELDASAFPADEGDTAYVAPQILTCVRASMEVMREETFGPVLGVVRVAGDAEAIAHMNDSRFGLTASIWTHDAAAAVRIGDQLETGTVFMNRCDYLDPGLAWTGVKHSGRGCALSRLGYETLTRPKSFHLRLS